MMKKIVQRARVGMIALAAAPFFFAGCMPTYETKLEERLKKRGFTQEQAEVGVVMGERMLFMSETKHEDDDGATTYTYEFNHGGVTIQDSLEKVTEVVKDLEELVSHKNTPSEEKFFDQFNLRLALEHQLTLFRYYQDKLTQRQLHNTFEDKMGTRAQWSSSDPHTIRPDEAYSLGSLLPDPKDDLTFDAKYVQEARSAGKLSDPKFIAEKIIQKISFQEKVPNPDYPLKDPNTEFIFKPRERNIMIISYHLDNNLEKNPTYIEAYRLNEHDTPESKPALKLFRPLHTSTLRVLVLDKDQESDKKGFGKPDRIQDVWDIRKGSDIIARYPEILEYIFKKEDIPPIPRIDSSANNVYVIETGKYPFAEYETKVDGWESALPDYKTGQTQNNFVLRVKLEDLAKDDADDEHKQTLPESQKKPRKIEWLMKEYRTNERVVEFYKPSDQLKDALVLRVHSSSTNEVEVYEKGHPIQKYSLEYALEEKPFRIDFDYSNEKRWSIVDKDGDHEHYTAKREIRRPDNLNLPPIAR